jgi:hypothetical protein
MPLEEYERRYRAHIVKVAGWTDEEAANYPVEPDADQLEEGDPEEDADQEMSNWDDDE